MSRRPIVLGGRALRARNSLLHGGGLEPLSASSSHGLVWYSCGPTVYDDAHLGHARAYVSLDVLRRVVTRLCRTPVTYALGVTDVDDKILARAAARGQSPASLARAYEARFFDDMRALGVHHPSRVLRVTEHVPHLVAFVQRLVDAGAAYAAGRDVYFSVPSAGKRYGQLDPSRARDARPASPPEAGGVWTRDGLRGEAKRDARDFALWKGCREGDPHAAFSWSSPWGRGRPGWHVECSAMVTAALGDRLDVHTGGIDLRFPHHTNELATAEAALCCDGRLGESERWANTWLHVGHLHMAGRKMSKSLKNFVTVRQFLESGGDPAAFRTFCLLHHYASAVEYSEDRLRDAERFLGRIKRFLEAARAQGFESGLNEGLLDDNCPIAGGLRRSVRDFLESIAECITADFDTPRAMGAVSKLVTAGNKALKSEGSGGISGSTQLALAEAAGEIREFLSALGLSEFGPRNSSAMHEDGTVDDAVLNVLVQFRERVRSRAKAKDVAGVFAECDNVRKQLEGDVNVKVEDVADGKSRWSRLSKPQT